MWEHRVTYRSADNVLAEMAELRDMGYSAVHFYDDSLALRKGRLRALCAGLRKLGLLWRCFVRADQMSPELLDGMAAANARLRGENSEATKDEARIDPARCRLS